MTDEEKKKKVLDFFDTHHIPYRLYEHPAFFTVADVQKYQAEHAGTELGALHAAGTTGCKNLFLKNYVETKPKTAPTPGGSAEEPYRYYLYTLQDIDRADLKAFAAHVGEKKVTFASSDELLLYMGVTPGSVSLCGLLNDIDKKVKVYVQEKVYNAPLIHMHPNINTASIELNHEALLAYLTALDRPTHVYRA